MQLDLFAAPQEGGEGGGRAALRVAHGARAAEEVLLAEVDALAAAAARDPRLLARPVRVVVPSRSLRAHVSERLVARRGRSLAGVRVQTLYGLALEVLERAGEPGAGAAAGGEALLPVLVERAARREAALAGGLEALLDGYAAAGATVRDLLDAGLEPAHAEAALEALAADGAAAGSRPQVERAAALVRVAVRAAAELERLGLARGSDLQRRAADRLAGDPGLLAARAVLVHGFAEVTGVAGDLLEAVLRAGAPRAVLIVDLPPDPAAGEAPVLEQAFARRLLERMAGVTERERGPAADAPPPPAALRRLAAPGADTEARAAAATARSLLDGGARPERIAIVARDLAPYRLPLRRHLRRTGVPFSALGEPGAAAPAARRVRALIELLRRGEAAPADRWLDAVARLGPGTAGERAWRLTAARRSDLRLALFALGAGRLGEVARLDLETVLGAADAFALPLRQGLAAPARNGGEDDAETEAAAPAAAWATRRRVPGDLLRAAAGAAGRLERRLRDWPRHAAVGEHLGRAAALLTQDLGWREEEDGEALAAFAALGAALPPSLPLSAEELRLLLRGALAEVGRGALGGAGGGVQVLSVTEARARTFDHLVLLGLDREQFPRPIREDPLLPDDLRAVLRRVLPDLPEKRTGFDEERYLFAQLLSASPAITLSWQETDDDGRARAPSPLVERLPLGAGEAVERVPPPFAPPAAAAARAKDADPPRPADELATRLALHGTRAQLGAVLPVAIAEARREHLAAPFDLPAAALAAARLAVLDELDPDRRTAAGRAAAAALGPYFGFVGPLPEAAGAAADPRLRPLFVTHMERLAGCPWQFFTARLLGVERAPDPLGALPAVDARLLGIAVHRALARIAREAGTPAGGELRRGENAPEFAALAALPPVAVPWPEPETLARLVREEAAAALREEGVPWPGLARVLAERAAPLLEQARRLDWEEGAPAVLGAELAGEVTVADDAGRPRRVGFRADRLDRAPDGTLRLTDYKTGRAFDPGKKRDTTRARLLAGVREGKLLQAMAYGLAAEGAARGRYLYLKPEALQPELAMPEDDPELARLFASTAAALLAVWDAGSFFPRLVEPDGRQEPGRCKVCEVAEACLRGDSGARRRLFEWSERELEPDAAGAAAALLRVWRLAAAEGEER